MKFTFDPSSLPESLLIAAKGILGTFVVIAAVMLVIYILNKTTKSKKKEQQ
ncbi:MAG: oxaloacetate decarboxylase [Eubacteriales bacterium]|nr:oxaloacetate decarboxylase [Eubacteriales bacterium]